MTGKLGRNPSMGRAMPMIYIYIIHYINLYHINLILPMFSVSGGFIVFGTGIPGKHQRCHQHCQECPIYDAFDWNMPMMTTIIAAFTLVGYAVLAGLYTAFAPLKKHVG